MDPLSTAASIIAVLTASIQSCKILVGFFHGVTDAPLEVQKNGAWLQASLSTLAGLQNLIEDDRFASVRAQLPAGFEMRLADCQNELQMMESHVSHIQANLQKTRTRRTWTRVKHSLGSDQLLAKFSHRLQSYMSAFAIDLTTIQIKLTILNTPLVAPADLNKIPHTTPALPIKTTHQLDRFLASYAEGISVRVSGWWTFETYLVRLEFWYGPVLKQLWRQKKPEYTINTPNRDHGVGFQVYFGWGQRLKSCSVTCMTAKASAYRQWTLPRLSICFPNIIPRHSGIFQQVCAGNVPAVKLLFSHQSASVLDTTPDGRGLLHIAASTNCLEMVTFLLTQGVNVNSKDEEGRTPLHFAVADSQNYDICRSLLENGADLGNCDIDGRTPLHSFFNSTISMILTHHREIVLQETMTRDTTGKTILQYINWSSKSQPEHLQPYLKGSDLALSLVVDDAGRSLLHFAAQRGNISLLRYLLSLSTDVGLQGRDATGQSVLHYAIHSRRTESIDILLKYGAPMDAVDNEGRTLLHSAARRNNIAAVKRVLELSHFPCLSIRDNNGMTAGDFAHHHGSFEVAAYLASFITEGATTVVNSDSRPLKQTTTIYQTPMVLLYFFFTVVLAWATTCI